MKYAKQKQTKITEDDLLYILKKIKLLSEEFGMSCSSLSSQIQDLRSEILENQSHNKIFHDTIIGMSCSSLSSQIQDLRSEILENQSHNKIFHDTIRSRENSKFSLRHPKILAPNMGGQNRLIPRSSFH